MSDLQDKLDSVREANSKVRKANRVLQDEVNVLTAQRDDPKPSSNHAFSDFVLAEHAIEVDKLQTEIEWLNSRFKVLQRAAIWAGMGNWKRIMIDEGTDVDEALWGSKR